MTSRQRFSILGTATLLLIGAVSVVMAQTPGTGRGASPMYDVKTETTITGTVESVDTVTGQAVEAVVPSAGLTSRLEPEITEQG